MRLTEATEVALERPPEPSDDVLVGRVVGDRAPERARNADQHNAGDQQLQAGCHEPATSRDEGDREDHDTGEECTMPAPTNAVSQSGLWRS